MPTIAPGPRPDARSRSASSAGLMNMACSCASGGMNAVAGHAWKSLITSSFDLESRRAGVRARHLERATRGIDPGHPAAQARQRLRQQAAAAAHVEHTQALEDRKTRP